MIRLDARFKKYIKLTSSNDINEICNPILSCYGITYFLYVKSFFDGRRLWLTNNGAWTEHFYENNHYKVSAFERMNEQYKPGFYLWSLLDGQEVFKDAREAFNIDHGITVVNQLADAFEFVHFGTTRDNHSILHFYMNNKENLNRFILYFRNNAENLIKTACDNMILLPSPKKMYYNDQILSPAQDITIKSSIPDFPTYKHQLSSTYGNILLTDREVICIDWLKKAKTANEIAEILQISKRTAEAHINNIKRKLNCYNSFQLGYKLAQIDYYQI